MKQFKTIIITIASVLGVFLAACGSDSGTGSGIAQAETVYGLGECEAANEGVIKLVTSENQYYKCVDGSWEVTEPPVQSSSSKSSLFAGSGILTDSRDGKTYRTVKIRDQVWMAENLNYGGVVSRCYRDVEEYCAKYGLLYEWTKAKSACPSGWHLPSRIEFESLFNAVGGEEVAANVLKSASGWEEGFNGTDDFGFSVLPVGCTDHGSWSNDGGCSGANFWSSTESKQYERFHAVLLYNGFVGVVSESIYYGFSVRCLQDYPSTVVKGTMTDERDGQTYRTVKIGNQVWMAENLNYRYLGSTADLDSSSFCYHNDANCDTYGRLYLWSAAMDSAGIIKGGTANDCGYDSECSSSGTVRGVCPAGWHLPSRHEWEELIVAVDGFITVYSDDNTAGTKLKSAGDWIKDSNTDAYSFSALPAGYYHSNDGYSEYAGIETFFWSSTEDSAEGADNVALYYDRASARIVKHLKRFGASVRCLKD